MSGARIAAMTMTPTHDGDLAAVAELEFPGGGRSQVHIDGESIRRILGTAGVDTIDGLVGLPWSVLECRRVDFAAARPTPD